MFTYVSIWGVLLATVAAMVIGSLWYSPIMFAKPWMKAMGLKQSDMQKSMASAMVVLVCVSLLTAFALSFIAVYVKAYLGGSGLVAGFRASLIAGIGLGVTTVFAYGAFDPRDKKLLYINSANRLVTIIVMGLIVGAFLK